MLPGVAELVSEWTGLPGRAKGVKRFETSNGLDRAYCAIYKLPLPFLRSAGPPSPLNFSPGRWVENWEKSRMVSTAEVASAIINMWGKMMHGRLLKWETEIILYMNSSKKKQPRKLWIRSGMTWKQMCRAYTKLGEDGGNEIRPYYKMARYRDDMV